MRDTETEKKTETEIKTERSFSRKYQESLRCSKNHTLRVASDTSRLLCGSGTARAPGADEAWTCAQTRPGLSCATPPDEWSDDDEEEDPSSASASASAGGGRDDDGVGDRNGKTAPPPERVAALPAGDRNDETAPPSEHVAALHDDGAGGCHGETAPLAEPPAAALPVTALGARARLSAAEVNAPDYDDNQCFPYSM